MQGELKCRVSSRGVKKSKEKIYTFQHKCNTVILSSSNSLRGKLGGVEEKGLQNLGWAVG